MKYNRPILIFLYILLVTLFCSTVQALTIPINLPPLPESLAYMTPAGQDPNFQNIINALGHSAPHLTIPIEGGVPLNQCNAGRYEILQKLDAIRAEHRDWFENLDYGPVEKGGQHEGVALYPKQKGPNPDYSPDGYMKAVKNGVVIDYTNYWSDWTGMYTVRTWGQWSWWDFMGKGSLLTGVSVRMGKLLKNPTGTQQRDLLYAGDFTSVPCSTQSAYLTTSLYDHSIHFGYSELRPKRKGRGYRDRGRALSLGRGTSPLYNIF